MQFASAIRLLLALGVALAFLLVLFALLFVTESAFNVWDQLRQAPGWFFAAYLGGFLFVGSVGGWLIWRLLRPRHRRRGAVSKPEPPAIPDEAEIEERLHTAKESGIDVVAAERELARLAQRREAGRVYVGLFGQISSGKSSLIRALLPDAEGAISVRGGTTRESIEHHWRSPAGDELVLVDMPGLNEVGASLDQLAQEEALRAHLVVYVCDGDLTRTEYTELQALLALGKPCILALNKMDRYFPEQLEAIKGRIRERLEGAGAGGVEIVSIRAGGSQEVVRILPDGREEVVVRELPPKVDELRSLLQRHIDRDPELLERLRDSAVFVLVSRRLEDAEAVHRRKRAEELVTRYSRRAVLGAMAAVTPGTDLIIQGYLGVSMVKELAGVYGVSVRKMDTDLLMELVQKNVVKSTTLMLAIAGNALKAFPGAGTLAGGAMHAVAYGIVFDKLGRAVVSTLETRGELRPVQAASVFKETLGENLEATAKRFVQLAALAQKQKESPGS